MIVMQGLTLNLRTREGSRFFFLTRFLANFDPFQFLRLNEGITRLRKTHVSKEAFWPQLSSDRLGLVSLFIAIGGEESDGDG